MEPILVSAPTHIFDCHAPQPECINFHLVDWFDKCLYEGIDLLMEGFSHGTFDVYTHTFTKFGPSAMFCVSTDILMHYASSKELDVANMRRLELADANVAVFFEVLKEPVEYGKAVYKRPSDNALKQEKLVNCPFFDTEHFGFFSQVELLDMLVETEVICIQNLKLEALPFGRAIVKKRTANLDYVNLIRFFSLLHANPKFQSFMAQGTAKGEEKTHVEIQHRRSYP